MKAARPGQFTFITRAQAARLLWAARHEHAPNRGERIGWALAAMKDSRHVQRLKIDYLLSIGNFDSADAMLARHLLTGREHPLMRLRFARSMFLQGRLDAARREIDRVIDERPHHLGAQLLGASIAAALGEHERAVEVLVPAMDQRPTCRRVRIRLIEALLDAHLFTHAGRELERLPHPPPALHARVLRAAGRTVDALDVLRQAADQSLDASQQPAVMLALAEVAETTGDIHQLSRMDQWLRHDSRIERTEWDAVRACVTGACRRVGLDDSLADLESVITTSSTSATPADDAEIARWWLGRLQGQLLAEQADATACGADPNPNLMPTLVEQAAATLDRHLGHRQGNGKSDDLRRHRDLLRFAIGRTD